MNCLQLSGKYIIKNGQNIIQAKNNLTVFGALQIARLLKRDIIFPKYANDYYGKIVSYNGQLKKISIKNGSDINCFDGGNSYVSTPSQSKNDLKKIIDGNKASFDILQFKDSEDGKYPKDGGFEIKLKQQLNISRIGIIAQQIRPPSPYSDNDYANQIYEDVAQLIFSVKPSGYRMAYSIKKKNVNDTITILDQWEQGNLGNINLYYSSGDYIRVYNPYQPTIGGRPYYLNYRIVEKDTYIYCLYYDTQLGSWAIAKASFNDLSSEYTNVNIASKFVVVVDKTIKMSLGRQNLSEQNKNTSDIYLDVQKDNIVVETRDFKWVLTKGVAQWLQPINRLYNYYIQDGKTVDGKAIEDNINGCINLLADIGLNYSDDNNVQRKVQYSANSTDFDAMVAYNCFSFEHLTTIKNFYGLDDETTYNSQQNFIGFTPYVSAIQFKRLKGYHDSDEYSKYRLKIYQIDLFSPCKIPYNPCFIALKSNGGDWVGGYVDSIQRKGKNTVVFTKTLLANQSMQNISEIGLFGNFSGHLDGTIPAQIVAKDVNCFSKAKFEATWNKQWDEQVIISYQLTIGDSDL